MMELSDEYEAKPADGPRRWAAKGCGPFTLTLMFLTVALFVAFLCGYSKLGLLTLTNLDLTNASELRFWKAFSERMSLLTTVLPELRHGQIWRLFTPIFIHFNFLSLFFNLLWLWWLGNTIEMRQGSFQLFWLVLFFAGVSNLAIYFFNGIGYAGLSGIVFSLAGYAWIRGKFDPRSRLVVHLFTGGMMGIWALGCLIGLMGPAINTAQLAGLLIGMLTGFLTSPGSFFKKLQSKPSMRLSSERP